MVLLLLFVITTGWSQEAILIPYRVGKKFGLANLKGKIIVPATYDGIEPIGGSYFKAVQFNNIPENSTNRSYAKPNNARIDLISGKKTILKNSEHYHFKYIPKGLLLGSENSYTSKNSNFYTLAGERLLPENVKGFNLMGPSDGEKIPDDSPYIAIFAMHDEQTISLYQFNTATQKMIPTVLDRVSEFKTINKESHNSVIICTYFDKDFTFHKSKLYFDRAKGFFVVEPYTSYQTYYPHSQNTDSYNSGYGEGSSTSEKKYVVATEVNEIDVPVTMTSRGMTKSFKHLSEGQILVGNDTLRLNPEETAHWLNVRLKQQTQPLIVQNGPKKRLLMLNSSNSTAAYDTLVYIKSSRSSTAFKQLYLAGHYNTTSQQWQLGVINDQNEVMIPFQYESIRPNLPNLTSDTDKNTNTAIFVLQPTKSYGSNPSWVLNLDSKGLFVVKQNGKEGLVTAQHDLLMPVRYEALWKNDVRVINNLKSHDDFYVYQEGNQYGVFSITYDQKLVLETQAVFPNSPIFYYKDYGDKKGFNLYALGRSGDFFLGFATQDGQLFFKD